MRRLLREPIVHFLVGGSIVFGLFSWFSAEAPIAAQRNEAQIVVEPETLLSFVQAKTKVADESAVRLAFAKLEPAARQEWIDRYVREEALVREARALRLDREDPIIRRRLAQKIEFLTLGLLDEELRINEVELEAFYRDHQEDYRVPTTVTLTHVFVEAGAANDEARGRAESLLVGLNDDSVSFREALGRGDRFLYNRNYVDRTMDEIRSHFGDEVAEAMAHVEIQPSVWTGPYQSEFGWHLILLTERSDSHIPPLTLVAGMARDDAGREKREAVLRDAVDAVISKYQVDQRTVDSWTPNSDPARPSASESRPR